jgi:hypothetical protein
VSPWQEINFPWTISGWGAVLEIHVQVSSCISGFNFIHAECFAGVSGVVCWMGWYDTWEQPIAFCFWYIWKAMYVGLFLLVCWAESRVL